MVEAALHRATRDAQDARHLVLVAVVPVAQDDRAALAVGQRGEQALRVEAGLDGVDHGALGKVRRIDRLRRRAPTKVAAAVDGDLEEPGGEAPRRIEAWRGLDDAQPGVLVEVVDITPARLPAEKR